VKIRQRAFLALFFLIPGMTFADMAKDIANELTENTDRVKGLRVAVLPFEYAGRSNHAFSKQLADDITYWLVKGGKVTVVERDLVDKVLGELAFQQTGAIDQKQALKLGKGLGAEAIITGTINDAADHKAVIHTRFIRTETFDIVGVSKIQAKRHWEAEPEKVQPPGPTNFIEAMGGVTNAKLDFELSNKVTPVNVTYAGMYTTGTQQDFTTISFQGLETNGKPPVLGLRGHFYYKYFGLGVEYLRFKHTIKPQKATWRTGGVDYPFDFSVDDFLQVTNNQVSMQFMVGYAFWRVFMPYLGVGGGFSLVEIKSDFIYSYASSSTTTSTTNKFSQGLSTAAFGLTFHALLGVRIIVASALSLFAEGRYFQASASFTRGIANEKDSVTLTGWQIMGGAGYAFN
jgi:opacity protein-like surface antigen/TolB-like protein